MDHPLDMRAFKDAIHEWVTDALAHEGLTVVWAEQDAPQPALPFVTLKITAGPVHAAGWAHRNEVDLTRAQAEIEDTTHVPANVTINAQAFVERQSAIDDDIDAVAVLDVMRSALSKVSVLAKLREANVAVTRVENPSDITALSEDSFVSRATMDVIFAVTLTVADLLTYIEKVEIESTDLDVDEIVE